MKAAIQILQGEALTGLMLQPGDSVLEVKFWDLLRKTKGGWKGGTDQFQIGRYRVDSIFDCDGRAVVVELDGKTFHDAAADHERDTELLKSVGAVIRIPFRALYTSPYATFKILGLWFGRFSMRDMARVIAMDELDRIYEQAANGDYDSFNFESWLEGIEHIYDVWLLGSGAAQVGTPRQFFQGQPSMVTIRRGSTSHGMIDRIYSEQK